MVTFLPLSPEFSKRDYTSYVFKLSCLCLGHVVPELSNVSLGSSNRSDAGVDLADVIGPLQSFIFSSSSEQNIFASAECISSCVQMLAEFVDRALQPSYDPRSSLVFMAVRKFMQTRQKPIRTWGLLPLLRRMLTLLCLVGVRKDLCHHGKFQRRGHTLIWAKHRRRLLQKLLLQNSVHLDLVVVAIVLDLNWIMWNVAILLVLFDVIHDIFF